jgi:hypothetical protein
MIVANVGWTFNTGGRSVFVSLLLNGTSKIAVVHGAPNNEDGNGTSQSVSTIWQLRQGDTVEVMVGQNSGGGEPKDIIANQDCSVKPGLCNPADSFTPEFGIALIAPM